RKLKKESGKDLVIMGSGSIVSQLTHGKLIDEYQIVVFPLILGSGKSMFGGVKDRLALTLTSTRAFKNGNVVLYYERKGA
ncbi:MAG TPA: dihydrofolate reductase family protein, partial [Spirochaetia bacterium]|nr:dihydrofolate reductase family protein [Spirochaetia bacterium]